MVRKALKVQLGARAQRRVDLRAAGHHQRAQPRRLFPLQPYDAQDRDLCDRRRGAQSVRGRPLRCLHDEFSGLYGERLQLAEPTEHIVLPEIISKEPLSPVVRQGDDQWDDIVRWTHFAMLDAEELGDQQSQCRREAEIRRSGNRGGCLASKANMARRLGLTNDWAYRIIKHVGNYGESFERNVGQGSPAEDRARPERAYGPRAACNTGRRSANSRRAVRQSLVAPRAPSRQRCAASRDRRRHRRPCLRRRRQRRAKPGACPCRVGFWLLEQHRRLRYQPDADSLFASTSTFGRAFWVGLLNTLLVAGIGIVLATVLGFIVGIARLSQNWLVARLAAGYVEIDPQRAAAAATVVLVQRRAQVAAGPARQHCAAGRRHSQQSRPVPAAAGIRAAFRNCRGRARGRHSRGRSRSMWLRAGVASALARSAASCGPRFGSLSACRCRVCTRGVFR